MRPRPPMRVYARPANPSPEALALRMRMLQRGRRESNAVKRQRKAGIVLTPNDELDVDQVAELAGLAPSTVRKKVRAGLFPEPAYTGTHRGDLWLRADLARTLKDLGRDVDEHGRPNIQLTRKG